MDRGWARCVKDPKGNKGLFFSFWFLISYNSVFKVQNFGWSPSYDVNKTFNQSNNPHHPFMGKVKPPATRAHSSPS